MKTGILFDLDGTLLDTLEDLADGVNYALGQFSLPRRTLAEVRRFVGSGAEKLIRRALPGRDDDPDALAVLAVFREYYNAHCREKTRPYGGIEAALAQLREKYPMAIVSNKPDSAVKTLCGVYFPGVYALGESAGCPRKPAPDMVRRAMEKLGVETCIYVGDSDVDVLTAKNAGVPCVSVLWGFQDKEDLLAAGAENLCETPEEMARMIEEMVGVCNGE